MIDVSASANYVGDCRELLGQLPDACVQTCITSPPYWGLRDYGHAGQIGLEQTPELFVAAMVEVFAKVRRVLRDDGTLWLNLGDSYAGSGRGGFVGKKSTLEGSTAGQDQSRLARGSKKHAGFHERVVGADAASRAWSKPPPGYKEKELVGVPWMVAFALRADGWYLRSDIIWHKPNPLPEPVADRPTKSHEYIFLLSKRPTYFYNADAVREPLAAGTIADHARGRARRSKGTDALGNVAADNWAARAPVRKAKLDSNGNVLGGNKRSVWTVSTRGYDRAHFATFPPKLIEPCVLAGSRVGDIVLDPFFGSGTTGEVAEKHGRRWIGFDLGYDELAKERTAQRSLMGRFK